jgi:hypothetical protein
MARACCCRGFGIDVFGIGLSAPPQDFNATTFPRAAAPY